jgi:hypothetical protein
VKSANLIKIKKYKKLLYKIRDSINESYDNCFKWYEILLKLGIKGSIYVDSTKLKYNSRKSKLRKLEWWLGQFVDAMDHKCALSIMSWENCFDKFVNDVKYIKPKLGTMHE